MSCRTLLGNEAIVRLRRAAVCAFLMLRRAAWVCFVEAMGLHLPFERAFVLEASTRQRPCLCAHHEVRRQAGATSGGASATVRVARRMTMPTAISVSAPPAIVSAVRS